MQIFIQSHGQTTHLYSKDEIVLVTSAEKQNLNYNTECSNHHLFPPPKVTENYA